MMTLDNLGNVVGALNCLDFASGPFSSRGLARFTCSLLLRLHCKFRRGGGNGLNNDDMLWLWFAIMEVLEALWVGKRLILLLETWIFNFFRVSTLSRFVVMFSAQCAEKSASSVIFTFYCRNLRPKRWRAALKMCLNGLI